MFNRKLAAVLVALLCVTLLSSPAEANRKRGPKYRVSASVVSTTAPQGYRFSIRGMVSPPIPGTPLMLQRKYAGTNKWRNGQRTVVQANGTYVFGESAETLRSRKYRVVAAKSSGIKKGISNTVGINVAPSPDFIATLRWSGAPDYDLHVTEPNGNEIYYSNSGPSLTGGWLDTDTNPGCSSEAASPTENVVWPRGSAPLGQYRIKVVPYASCGQPGRTWLLEVRVHGRIVLSTSGIGASSSYFVNVDTRCSLCRSSAQSQH